MTEQFYLPEQPLRVVVMACSQGKLSCAAPASELYTGAIWWAWRKHGPSPSGPLACGWKLLILSAAHGLIEPQQEVEPYDRQLTPSRIEQLAPVVAAQWAEWSQWQKSLRPHYWPPTVAVLGGALYQELAARAGLPVELRIDGSRDDGRGGIGWLKRQVGEFAQALLAEADREPFATRAWRLP